MVKVCIIGSGNVAQHLAAAFEGSEQIELVQVYARDKSKMTHLIAPEKITDDLTDLAQADLYIISVTDNAVSEISSKLPFSGRLVAHTSGSVSIDLIDSKNRRAVFYPLQTFTKNKSINFKEIPICIEAVHQIDYAILNKAASAISGVIQQIDSGQRKALHVAAVFVSNFTNHLYQIGCDICIENNLPFDILKPLIAETANKVRLLSPAEAQTGPARRGDTKTIETHLEFLQDDKHKLYEILTQSIINHGKKL
jgi:predicted short-subunit dehydrogenase-like oxidoreductase (DUF2520 family)